MYANGLHWESYPGELETRFAASSDGPARVLDLGQFLLPCARCVSGGMLTPNRLTGSGMTATWCLSMAERYPEIEIIGVGTFVFSRSLPLAYINHSLTSRRL